MRRIEPDNAGPTVADVLGVLLVALYVATATVLSCGCALHVGEAPCLEYARAVETRLGECGLTDEWYRERLAGIYGQCDTGPLGITLVDGDHADACVDRVRDVTCEALAARGAPTCISEIQL